MEVLLDSEGLRFLRAIRSGLQRAQRQRALVIGNTTYQRLPYGSHSEDDGIRCLECLVRKRQLHCMGCHSEQCPRCHQIVAECRCVFGSRHFVLEKKVRGTMELILSGDPRVEVAFFNEI